MINDGSLSFDEIFGRWSQSSLAKIRQDIQIRHLGMAPAGRGLSANDNNTTDEIRTTLSQNDFTI
jgi:hypothetical protein